jgi:hypothetical protein
VAKTRDGAVSRAVAFVAGGRFVAVFFTDFFAVAFFAVAFLAAVLFAAVFLVALVDVVFLAVDFPAAALFAADFLVAAVFAGPCVLATSAV